MHRPTEENRRITPGNKDAYLFRDVVYWKVFNVDSIILIDNHPCSLVGEVSPLVSDLLFYLRQHDPCLHPVP